MITPQAVKDYTAYEAVKDRTDAQLRFDIIQAKEDIFKYCGHDFAEHETLPEEVELAFIKLSEYYALINSDEGLVKGIKSESLGDYSYTLASGEKYHLSLENLLYKYVKSTGQKGTKFKMGSI